MGLPGGPGSAKDTGLNVGSHDVTSDIEVDADEFALPTKTVYGQFLHIRPSPIPTGRWARRWQGACGVGQPHRLRV